MQLGAAAQERRQPLAEQVEEPLLADPPALELEQGVCAVELVGPGDHRLAELLERDPVVVLERREGAEQRGREDAAEVADDGTELQGQAERIS